MIEQDRRVRIITGNYGSGKTEFAINYAVALNKAGKKTALADLDIVNVYFRSREKTRELEKMGIHVISSSLKGNAVDIPAIPAEVVSPLRDKSYHYVIDLGGNEIGTKVMGTLKPDLKQEEIDVFMVVNLFRPETANAEKIILLKEQLESTSGLKITGLVNNTNLIGDTDIQVILSGEKILEKVTDITGIPIRYTTYVEEIVGKLSSEKVQGELFSFQLYMREMWMG